MKRQTKRKATSASFFDEPAIKKIYADPVRKANIEAISNELFLLEKIARIRTQEGITQKKLAALTHIRQDEISRIERGHKNITYTTMTKILNGLGYELRLHKRHA
jgi:DNA-binding XRE family transcriptional regulator